MGEQGRLELRVGEGARGLQALLINTESFTAMRQEGHPRLPGWDGDRLSATLERSRFQAKSGQTLALTENDGSVSWLVGCGTGLATAQLRRAAASSLSVIPDGLDWTLGLPLAGSVGATHVQAVMEGLLLGSYVFDLHKRRERSLGCCSVMVPSEVDGESLLRWTEAIAAGTCLTRDLVNTPAADLGPGELAQAAVEIAQRHGMRSETWSGSDLLERGFRMVHAVGRASARAPTVTVVRAGPKDVPPALALIGKGVVFDSGGLNLKPASGMLLMRKDMGGAGTVLGILEAWGRLGKELPLLAVIPAAENAVGPDSYRPGDVLRSYDGTTVEIGNTDAEGRLLLADAMSFARDQSPARMLDLATLTGAARVALGPDVPALFGTDEDLVERLLETSLVRDEPLWRMPLVKRYNEFLETPFADVNHMSSDSRGGCITAALFLQRFAGDVPWAHIDLYGWEDKGRPDVPKGANGMLVRTVVEVMEQLLEI